MCFEINGLKYLKLTILRFLPRPPPLPPSLPILLQVFIIDMCIKNYPAFYEKYRPMKIAWGFSIYSNSYKHNALKIFHFLSQEFLSYLPVKFVYFVKSRLFLTSWKLLRFKTQSFLSMVLRENEHIDKFLKLH